MGIEQTRDETIDEIALALGIGNPATFEQVMEAIAAVRREARCYPDVELRLFRLRTDNERLYESLEGYRKAKTPDATRGGDPESDISDDELDATDSDMLALDRELWKSKAGRLALELRSERSRYERETAAQIMAAQVGDGWLSVDKCIEHAKTLADCYFPEEPKP